MADADGDGETEVVTDGLALVVVDAVADLQVGESRQRTRHQQIAL